MQMNKVNINEYSKYYQAGHQMTTSLQNPAFIRGELVFSKENLHITEYNLNDIFKFIYFST